MAKQVWIGNTILLSMLIICITRESVPRVPLSGEAGDALLHLSRLVQVVQAFKGATFGEPFLALHRRDKSPGG